MHSFVAPTFPAVRRSILGMLMLAMPLAACSAPYDTVATTASIPDDYHVRHPIVLANAPHRLDVFLVGESARLDDRQTEDVRGFAADYKTNGQGPISAMLPMVSDQRSVRATLEKIRQTLSKSGVRGSMLVGKYSVVDPTLAAPVELTFVKLQAEEASRCGEWPDDLASGSSLQTWDNTSYHNFGCATQKDFAMQIADPRDLVRPRVEDPSDVHMRTRAIGDIRNGVDPGTVWSTTNTSISPVGAN